MPDFFIPLRRGRSLLLALLAATLALPVCAQGDPPGRVGRIAWISGDVYLDDTSAGQGGVALLNRPLTSGDGVTIAAGRAEIEIGAMTLRLDGGAVVKFSDIDDERVRVLLETGRLIVKLPTEDAWRDFVLETASGRFLPRAAGIYRFDEDGAGVTATAYFGALRFDGRNEAFDIDAGESARVWRDGGYRVAQGVRDEFAQWSAARDQRQADSAPSRYVSPEMTGARDLDAHGDWSETPDYGAVWFPRAVGDDWAPYRDGQWAWIAPWGWTWIGREPWGFAPFHYGRWVRVRGSWAWSPGIRGARPVYAPALVGWIGAPGGVSSGVAPVPPTGWFPLAPREVYVPFYRASPAHVRLVNAPHVARIGNVGDIVARPRDVMRQTPFIHRDEPRAVSAAPADAFGHRRPGARVVPRPGDARDSHGRAVPETPRRAAEIGRLRSADAPLQRPRPSPPDGAQGRRDRPESGVTPYPMPTPRVERPPRRVPESFPDFRERRESAPRTFAPTPMPSRGTAETRTAPPAARERPTTRPREIHRPREQGNERREMPSRVERGGYERRPGGTAGRR
ncbi:MAG: hypothetical protein LBI87_14255 [Candidatus Accumulibacter sp.]|nr:hypothetical protein [Accumulibacter sp.]